MKDDGIIADGVKWWISTNAVNTRIPQPVCPTHGLRLWPTPDSFSSPLRLEMSHSLKCEDCEEAYILPRNYLREKQYILDKLDSKIFKGMKFINLDDEALPIAEDKIPKNSEYFVTSVLTRSKLGLRLVVYAGKKEGTKKTQIFVEPDIKRLAFDQKDLHPNDVFTKLEATFADGSKASQEK